MPSQRIFITGASGKLGLRLTKLLVDRGEIVTGLGRSPAAVERITSVGATAVEGLLTDVDLIKRESANAQAVFHCAFNHDDMSTGYVQKCEEDRACINAAIDGLKSSPGDKFFAYMSGTLGSNGTDEDAKKFPNEHMPRHLSEDLTLESATPTLRTCVLRLSPVVHEAESIHPFVMGMISAARKNGYSGYVHEDSVWPSAHYDDVADLCVLALDKAPSGRNLIAAAEGGVSTKAIAEWVGELTSTPVKQVPADQAMGLLGFSGMVLSFPGGHVTTEKTRAWTGWQPHRPKLLDEYRARGLKEGE